MSLSTVFQSYQDDGRLIMKGCVQWSSVYNESSGDPCAMNPVGIKLGPLDQ